MLLIDGDILAYRAACAVENNDDANEAMARYTVDSLLAGITASGAAMFNDHDYTVYMTGASNFRDGVAVTAPYKGHRGEKPFYLPHCRDQLFGLWEAVMHEPYEADDLIATAATELANPVIVSLDKDFNQLPVPMYNFVTGEVTTPTPEEAEANLYRQCLTGDAVDNIIGAEGCGPVTAASLIKTTQTELTKALICIDQLGYDRFMENMQLVYLHRHFGEDYVPPTEIFDGEYYCGVY